MAGQYGLGPALPYTVSRTFMVCMLSKLGVTSRVPGPILVFTHLKAFLMLNLNMALEI